MHSRGQLSLEYLILLAAALSVFAVLLPLLSQVYEAALFGLDSANAKAFSKNIALSVEEASFQADGALKLLKAEPLGTWVFSSSGSQLSIEVLGPSGRKKAFVIEFPNKLPQNNLEVSGQATLKISKTGGRILLEYRQP